MNEDNSEQQDIRGTTTETRVKKPYVSPAIHYMEEIEAIAGSCDKGDGACESLDS